MLKLDTLESRSIKSDVVLFYKVINNLTNLNVSTSFRFTHSFRGHNLHLYHFYYRTDVRKYFWSNRIVSLWNNLDIKIVNSKTLSKFKFYMSNHYVCGRGSFYCA